MARRKPPAGPVPLRETVKGAGCPLRSYILLDNLFQQRPGGEPDQRYSANAPSYLQKEIEDHGTFAYSLDWGSSG